MTHSEKAAWDRVNKRYLKEHVSRDLESLDSPIGEFVHELHWFVMLFHINGDVCLVGLPWLPKINSSQINTFIHIHISIHLNP